MNVSIDEPVNDLWLAAEKGPAPTWKLLAKDGYDLPAWQQRKGPTRQRVSIGETYDVSVTFPSAGEYTMLGVGGDGAVYAKQVIHVTAEKK
jgi:hypothetical protein